MNTIAISNFSQILEYVVQVWSPYYKIDINSPEGVQSRKTKVGRFEGGIQLENGDWYGEH